MAYSRLFSEAVQGFVQGFPSFGSLKEDECLEQKQQWFCKEAKYGIIYVGTLNLSSLPKNILFSEAVQGFPSFGNLKEDECLEQKQQWFCKEAKYGIIYVGTLNLSSLPKNILPPSDCINRAEEVEWLPKNILPPSDCINRAEEVEWEFTETVKHWNCQSKQVRMTGNDENER
ncbi:hypothetical protein QE152_g23210 [Popillia japonica]|uniref:Uncharacterized protein n=1 Tax=Popillia japonica TaxID=7064 RepID=A0AAW1KJJ4_POPJA